MSGHFSMIANQERPQAWAPGMAWVVAGPPAAPGSLGARRTAALVENAYSADRRARADFSPHEITMVPALQQGEGGEAWSAPGALGQARASAPGALLRLEWWLETEAPALAPEVLAACEGFRPLCVHLVLAAANGAARAAGPAAEAFLRAGLPVAADMVLARGLHDTPESLRAACLDLLRMGVRPYRLISGAWLAPGTQVERDEAMDLVRGLRGWVSGLAVPQLVEEQRDGRRVLLVPPHVTALDGEGVEVVNYEGRRLRYENPPGGGV